MPICCLGAFRQPCSAVRLPWIVRLPEQSISNALRARLASDLNEAAAGVVEIINNNMARAIRTVSIGRGHDPRHFVLVAFGGAGPLHACRLAELLDIPAIVIPPTPGVLSTYGLLSTDLKNDYVQTCYQEGPQFDRRESPRFTPNWQPRRWPGFGQSKCQRGPNDFYARPTCAMRIRASNSPVPCPLGRDTDAAATAHRSVPP